MKTIRATGEAVCETREELARKYFTFESTIQQYKEGNMGIISLLSDCQEMINLYVRGDSGEHYREILNDIKSILIEDAKKGGQQNG